LKREKEIEIERDREKEREKERERERERQEARWIGLMICWTCHPFGDTRMSQGKHQHLVLSMEVLSMMRIGNEDLCFGFMEVRTNQECCLTCGSYRCMQTANGGGIPPR
jgi:hypothetical protein